MGKISVLKDMDNHHISPASTVNMLLFGAFFHLWVAIWAYFYVGNALEIPNIVSGWRKHRRPNIVVFVDPLDDYGATSEIRTTCTALGLRIVNMWSPQVSRKLLSYLEQNDEVTMELAGVSVDRNDILDGTYTAPLVYQSNEVVQEDDRYAHATDQALAWLTHHDINVNEVLGVICESDVGLRTAEEFAISLQLTTANPRCEARRDKYLQQEAVRHAITLWEQKNRESNGISRDNNDMNSCDGDSSNGSNRRDGMRYGVIQQVLTDDWSVAKDFLTSLTHHNKDLSHNNPPNTDRHQPFLYVIKPCRGSASLGVFLATTMEEAETIFRASVGTYGNGFANGTASAAVLVQECIQGLELVIDTVSCQGKHKMVAVWRYDKRPLNGAPFVYHCTELLPVQNDGTVLRSGPGLGSGPAPGQGLGSEEGQELRQGLDVTLEDMDLNRVYAFCDMVLTALDVKNGPAHIEVMIRPSVMHKKGRQSNDSSGSSNSSSDSSYISGSSSSIVLIEANCGRWHGQDTVPLCNSAYGYNAATLSIIALLAASGETDALQHWQNIPFQPPSPKCAARIVHLVSHVEGVLTTPPKHLDTITQGLDDVDHQSTPSSSTTSSTSSSSSSSSSPPSTPSSSSSPSTPSPRSRPFPSLLRWASKFDQDSVGETIERTVDLHTTAGYALLMHGNREVVDDDYYRLIELQSDMYDVS